MDSKRIGIVNDLAIIVEKIKGKFYPIKAVTGYYVFNNNIFVDKEGNSFEHLIFYDAKNKKQKYFIGNIQLTKSYFKNKKDNVENSYFDLFKNYSFTIKNDDIICENLITKDKFKYNDTITNIHDAVQQSLKELLSQINPEEEQEDIEKTNNFIFNQSITEIKDNLKKHIKGQDSLVDKIASSIFEKYTFEESLDSNMILIVPSEDEKRQLMRAIKNSVNIPVFELKLPDFATADDDSYDADTLIVKLLNNAKEDINIVENSIIFINGLEKISLINKSSDYKQILKKVQKNLTELLDKESIIINYNGEEYAYDSSKNLFIGIFNLNKFENLNNDNIITGFNSKTQKSYSELKENQCGFTTEFLNKFQSIIPVEKSSADEIYNIILNDENGFVSKTKKMLENEYGIEIKNLEHIIKTISNNIAEKKITTPEAIKIIQKMFEIAKHEIYEHPGEYNELVFGKNILNDNTDYHLRKIDKKIRILTEK